MLNNPYRHDFVCIFVTVFCRKTDLVTDKPFDYLSCVRCDQRTPISFIYYANKIIFAILGSNVGGMHAFMYIR